MSEKINSIIQQKLTEIEEKENIKIVEISTMKELGLMSGIEVKSAATLIIEK